MDETLRLIDRRTVSQRYHCADPLGRSSAEDSQAFDIATNGLTCIGIQISGQATAQSPASPINKRVSRQKPARFRARRSTTRDGITGHRWDSPPRIRFAPDSPREEDGFELPVPLAKAEGYPQPVTSVGRE